MSCDFPSFGTHAVWEHSLAGLTHGGKNQDNCATQKSTDWDLRDSSRSLQQKWHSDAFSLRHLSTRLAAPRRGSGLWSEDPFFSKLNQFRNSPFLLDTRRRFGFSSVPTAPFSSVTSFWASQFHFLSLIVALSSFLHFSWLCSHRSSFLKSTLSCVWVVCEFVYSGHCWEVISFSSCTCAALGVSVSWSLQKDNGETIMRPVTRFSCSSVLSHLLVAILAQAICCSRRPLLVCGPSGREWSFSRVCSSVRRSGMPRRGWQTVEVPAWWFEVILGRRRELAQGTAQRFSSSSTRLRGRSQAQAERSPTVFSCQWQREAHARRRASGRTRTRGEFGSRHHCRWRVGSYFPSAPRGSQTSTEASTGATSGEPDQVFGVLHRAGKEAGGESTQGGGGCEGQGCRRRVDIDLRIECIAGRRTASCSPLGGSIEDGRAATTHDVCGFRSRIGAIEVFDAARCCHTSRGGSPTEVYSVVVHTSFRFDVATESIGHQQWQWERSEPVSVDGNVDRRRVSRGIPPIVSDAAVANGPVVSCWRESGHGLRGVRVGEAPHPWPPRRRRRMEVKLSATQADSDTTTMRCCSPNQQTQRGW